MQLAGAGAFGLPKDRKAASAVLREAVAAGDNHIDIYGPYITNQLIREALAPYPDDLVIATKVGALRDDNGAWLPASSNDELTRAAHDNLRNLHLDVLGVVNLRIMPGDQSTERSIEAPLTGLAELQQQGLVRHIWLSNVTAAQVAEGRELADIVCVQNEYNLAHRGDGAPIDALARDDIAYVSFFPLDGFTPLQSATLDTLAASLHATPADAGGTRVAAAAIAQRRVDPRHLVRYAPAREPCSSPARFA